MRHEGFAALFMLICCSNPDFIALTVEQEIIFLLAFNKVRMHIKQNNNNNNKKITLQFSANYMLLTYSNFNFSALPFTQKKTSHLEKNHDISQSFMKFCWFTAK